MVCPTAAAGSVLGEGAELPALARTALGLLMVGLAAVGTDGPAFVVAALAVLAVGAAEIKPSAATIAVLLTVAVIVASDPPYVPAALSGLCAAGYLVSRHLAESWVTVVGAVGFTFVGLVATSFPLQVPWLPLLAPLAVLAIYAVVTRPFVS